jgi:LSD1 subclass zinc finger protein
MRRNRPSLPLHHFNLSVLSEDPSVSSLDTPGSSGEEMSSDDDSCYDSTRLLRDIKEALDITRQPESQQASINPWKMNIAETHAGFRDQYSIASPLRNDNLSMIDDKDELMIEEQFRILQQIESEKLRAKSSKDQGGKMKVDELKYSKTEKLDFADTKVKEWEGKFVKLLDVQHAISAISTGDALYIRCKGCSADLGYPKESTHLYCPICHTLHTL